jgi:hypothetical protein
MLGPTGAGPTGVDKAAEADDPLELVGVPVPVDEATFDEMARCFVEEYVRDGWSDERLFALFRSPFYAGLHVIWLRRGEPWVRALVAETRLRWRRPARPLEGPA